MTIIASTTQPVFRHRQDQGVSCGRACAQMIISSLGQAGTAGTTSINVEQETLRTRETNKIDIENWWFTEPDELRALLAGAPELTSANQDWRVAVHTTADKLLADLILGMQAHGRPAAVTTGTTEHWVVLTRVQQNAAGQQVFEFYNPLPSPLVHGIAFQHLYMDALCGLDQEPMVVVNRGSELADLNLKIAGIPKPTTIKILSPPGEHQAGVKLPPASAVGTYSGKAVGVAFGPRPATARITKLAGDLKTTRLSQQRIMASHPVDAVRSNLRLQFLTLTDSFDLTSVKRILGSSDLQIVATRVVEDLADRTQKYVLCTGYSNQGRAGFIAAFDAAAEGSLLHLQITTDVTLIKSLTAFPEEVLYWTLQPTSHFPPMAMPYFVFRRSPGQPDRLIRLYDGVEGSVIRADMP